MSLYARRFVLPLLLLGGAVAAWLVGTQLSGTEQSAARTAIGDEPGAPLASVRRLPEFATTSLVDEAVSEAIASLPEDPGGLSCTAVLIDGEPVVSIRTDRPLVPAYAQLAITGHAALDTLGASYQFETRAMANDAADDAGTLRGGLFLVGGGDPVLMTRTYALRFDPILSTLTPVESLADAVREAGVTSVEGGITGVAGRYDTERSLTGWPDEYRDPSIVGLLGALQLNDGAGGTEEQDDPTRIAADIFRNVLEDADISVSGNNWAVSEGDPLSDLVTIARVSSPPLNEIVFQMLAANDAGAAELLLKELAVNDGAIGSSQRGAQVVQRVLQAQGVAVDVPFRDGSGLDPIGGTTCAQLATAVDSIPDEHPTLGALPAFGLPGVLDGGLQDIELVSDFRVVGGTQGDATGMVGRTIDQGRRITIASIVNRPGGPRPSDVDYQRALVQVVDDLRSSVTVDSIAAGE